MGIRRGCLEDTMSGLVFRICGLGVTIWGLGFEVEGFGFWV